MLVGGNHDPFFGANLAPAPVALLAVPTCK